MARYITEKQRLVLEFIQGYGDSNGYAPSIRDVAGRCECSVKGAYDHVVALEKKGLIERSKNRSRSILVASRGKRELSIAEPQKVPIYGSIAAGVMTYADEKIEDYVTMPVDGIGDDKCFALRVKGDSMVGAGIREGDIVVFREQQTAQTGDIVAAMVDDEATIKFYFSQGGRAVLKAANPLYPDMFFTELRILGKLKSLIRVYD